MSLSPAADLMAVARDDRLVLLSRKDAFAKFSQLLETISTSY